MRELLCVFVAIFLVVPAFAAGEVDKTSVVAAASYVDGAYNHMNATKQDKLTSTNVVESGTGAIVTGVAANNGTVTVSKSEVTIPTGTETGPTSGGARVEIWFE